MINENMYRPEKQLDPDIKMGMEFKEFIDANKFTADQIREAYHQFCGISENDKQDQEGGVEKILAKMNEMAENKFPINRLAELVGTKQRHEDAIPNYYKYVESLNVSNKEKQVLRSIVEKNRSGEVECLVNGKVIDGFKIKNMDESAEMLAEELEDIISKIIEKIPQGKKCKFMFIED